MEKVVKDENLKTVQDNFSWIDLTIMLDMIDENNSESNQEYLDAYQDITIFVYSGINLLSYTYNRIDNNEIIEGDAEDYSDQLRENNIKAVYKFKIPENLVNTAQWLSEFYGITNSDISSGKDMIPKVKEFLTKISKKMLMCDFPIQFLCKTVKCDWDCKKDGADNVEEFIEELEKFILSLSKSFIEDDEEFQEV